MLFKKFNQSQILENISKKNKLTRYCTFILGVMIIALAFNIFVEPSKILYGVSGLAIVLNNVFHFSTSLVILVVSCILLVVSFSFFGMDKTKNTIIGSILYPVFVKLTETIPNYLDLTNIEPVVIAVFGAVLTGIGTGLVFKSGFTTGGTDILNQLVSKYFKMSVGKAMTVTDGVIVVLGFFIFGLQSLIYSIISLYIISIMTDKVILGISNNKTFFIVTSHEKEVKQFILKYLTHGVTILEAQGGFSGKDKKVIMCTIPTKEYFLTKEGILDIDKNAFFVVTDAYEVKGGA